MLETSWWSLFRFHFSSIIKNCIYDVTFLIFSWLYRCKALTKTKKGACMKDEDIINLYFMRDERAIEETDLKYGKYCKTIVKNILQNAQDIEECLDDTYMKMWKRIPPAKPLILRAFIGKIARDLALNMFYASKRVRRGGGVVNEILEELDECIPDNNDVEHFVLRNELSNIIRTFVNELGQRDAYIFTSRYFYAEDISSIARKYGMTRHNVTVTLSRLRKKLQCRLEKEGYLAS